MRIRTDRIRRVSPGIMPPRFPSAKPATCWKASCPTALKSQSTRSTSSSGASRTYRGATAKDGLVTEMPAGAYAQVAEAFAPGAIFRGMAISTREPTRVAGHKGVLIEALQQAGKWDQATRAMIAAARRVVALIDYSKFASDQFVRFANWSDIDVLITNHELDSAIVTEIEATGTTVVLT